MDPPVHGVVVSIDARAPAAASLAAVTDSGRPEPNRLHKKTRRPPSYPWSLSAAQMVAGGAIPKPSAVPVAAGVEPPACLGHLTGV